jgi:hypothetical protein
LFFFSCKFPLQASSSLGAACRIGASTSHADERRMRALARRAMQGFA